MKHIYLLKLENSLNTHKIGISVNPIKRIKQLQTGSPDIIEMICSYESEYASKIESTLHRRFTLNRLKGEWFEIKLSKEEFLDECKKIDKNLKFIKKHATKIFF